MDHDLSLSPEGAHGEGIPIRIATEDSTFDPFRTGRRFIPFSRSAWDAATGTELDNPREQVGHCPDQGQGPVSPGVPRGSLSGSNDAGYTPNSIGLDFASITDTTTAGAHTVTNIRSRVLSRSTGRATDPKYLRSEHQQKGTGRTPFRHPNTHWGMRTHND